MKAVWIKDNKVENITIWDENSRILDGQTIVLKEDDFFVAIGFLFDGTNFTPPR